MNNVLEIADKYENLSEIHEILKTVEVVKNGEERYRIEIVKQNYRSPQGYQSNYEVFCWRYEEEDHRWRKLVTHDIPHASSGLNEVGVLHHALQYLSTGKVL